MRISSLVLGFAAVLSFTAFAQAPALQAEARPTVAEARAQLESLLACKAGTRIEPKAVEAHFAALGMVKGPDGIFVPSRGARVDVFGAEAVAAAVYPAEGEAKAAVYLRGQKADPLAKKLGANKVDEQANTDERSYFRQTSKKTTLLVGAASEFMDGNAVRKYQSSVTCQVN